MSSKIIKEKEKNYKTEVDQYKINSEIYNEKYKILRDKIKRDKIIKIEENKYQFINFFYLNNNNITQVDVNLIILSKKIFYISSTNFKFNEKKKFHIIFLYNFFKIYIYIKNFT